MPLLLSYILRIYSQKKRESKLKTWETLLKFSELKILPKGNNLFHVLIISRFQIFLVLYFDQNNNQRDNKIPEECYEDSGFLQRRGSCVRHWWSKIFHHRLRCLHVPLIAKQINSTTTPCPSLPTKLFSFFTNNNTIYAMQLLIITILLCSQS